MVRKTNVQIDKQHLNRILIGIGVVILFLIIFMSYFTQSVKKQIELVNEGYNKADGVIVQHIADYENESKSLRDTIRLQHNDIVKLKLDVDKKFNFTMNNISNNYDKKINAVSNTPIDTTVDILSVNLSKKDY